MKNQRAFKLLTLVFTLVILATLSINTFALASSPAKTLLTNIPDSEVDGTETRDDVTSDAESQTGVVDDAITKASEALEDAKDTVDNAITDAKDDVEDAVDDVTGGGAAGILIAIIIAVIIIILIIVMVSKNNGKYNRK